MKQLTQFLLLLVSSLLISQTTFATSMMMSKKPKTQILKDMTISHPLIVRGKVVSQRTQFAESNVILGKITPPMIFTYTTIKLERVFKGSLSSQTIEVKTPGGCVMEKNLCFQSDLFPNFTPQEDVLVFLKKDNAGEWGIQDLQYGKMSVRSERLHLFNLSLEEAGSIMRKVTK